MMDWHISCPEANWAYKGIIEFMGKTKAIPFVQGRLEAGPSTGTLWVTHIIGNGSLFQTIPKRFQDGPEKHLFDSNEEMHRETGILPDTNGCNAYGCQGESGERCYMSTIWGYFGFIQFVGWSRTLIASDSEPLVTVSLTCPVLRTEQYSTPTFCALFRMKARRNTLSTCGVYFLGMIW